MHHDLFGKAWLSRRNGGRRRATAAAAAATPPSSALPLRGCAARWWTWRVALRLWITVALLSSLGVGRRGPGSKAVKSDRESLILEHRPEIQAQTPVLFAQSGSYIGISL